MKANRPNPYRQNPYKPNPYKPNANPPSQYRASPYNNYYGNYNRNRSQGLSSGNWITIISGALFIFSLFLDWISTFGFGAKGYDFMKFETDFLSGQPILFPLTLIAVIVCVLLSTHILTTQGPNRAIPVIRLIFAIIGLIPFILFAFALNKYNDVGSFFLASDLIKFAFGGWLAILGAAGLLLGAIMTMNED